MVSQLPWCQDTDGYDSVQACKSLYMLFFTTEISIRGKEYNFKSWLVICIYSFVVLKVEKGENEKVYDL